MELRSAEAKHSPAKKDVDAGHIARECLNSSRYGHSFQNVGADGLLDPPTTAPGPHYRGDRRYCFGRRSSGAGSFRILAGGMAFRGRAATSPFDALTAVSLRKNRGVFERTRRARPSAHLFLGRRIITDEVHAISRKRTAQTWINLQFR